MSHNKAISGQLSENRYLMIQWSLYIWILLIFFFFFSESAGNGKRLLAEPIVVDVVSKLCVVNGRHCSLLFLSSCPS